MTTGSAQRFFLPGLLAALLLLLAQCLWLYGNTGRDDAFFTYWPATTLTEHGAILNYSGETVEQSSTLLLTVTLAALHTLLPAVTMPLLAWMVSLGGGALVLLATALTLRERQVSALATVTLASAPALVFWSSSGMETSLATALFSLLLWLCLQQDPAPPRRLALATVAALAVLCRPEAFFVIACFVAAAWFLTRRQHAQWISLLLVATTTFVAVSLWRHAYFGAWFPQPVSAKQSPFTGEILAKGLFYLLRSGDSLITRTITLAGLLAWLVALVFLRHPQRHAILVAGSLALAQIAFIMATGGDWMDASRFLVPVLPALLLCVALLFAPLRKLQHVAFAALLALALVDSWQFVQRESTGFSYPERAAAQQQYLPAATDLSAYSVAELQTKDALRDIPQLEQLHTLIAQLREHAAPLQVASIQMGFIPYHLASDFPGRLHFLDLRGLSSTVMTSCWILRDFPRTDTGIQISYDEFFALLPALQRQCGVQKPDIIYDMGYGMRQQALQDNGYIVTWHETRSVQGRFSRRAIGSELFIAVRRELAAQYGIHAADGSAPVATRESTSKPPNIVLLIADDISYDNLGFMGSRAARTPTLDQLAQQGTVFTTGYVPTAFCRPSLATLLTGQWPHQNRIYANNGVIALPPATVTLATRLQQRGYATFSGGKFWEDEPETRGFDSFDRDWNSFARKNQDKLWQFIDQHGGQQPLFIWWAPMLPHQPHNPPQQFLDAIDANAIAVNPGMPADQQQTFREQEKILLAMMLWFDSEFARLQQHLADKQLLDNTLFVFLADNGFSNRAISKSAPHELGLRTPIVFHWPGHVPVQRLAAGTDTIHLFSTILDYAGVPTPASTPYSHSLRPVIEQQQAPVAEKLFGADYPAVTMKTDPLPRPERDIFALHVRDGDWKYIFYLRELREEDNRDLTIKSGAEPFPTRNPGDEELYYLPSDTYEEHNLALDPQQQQRVADYRRQVLQWWYSTGGKTLDATQGCPAEPAALCRKLEQVNQ